MNVLYNGVENPITVSVSGIPADKISVKISNGEISGENGKNIAKVNLPGTAQIEFF